MEQLNINTATDSYISHLRNAFINTSMSHVQINAVLRAVRTHPCFKNVPVDERTILLTPRSRSSIVILAGGEYLYLGIKTGIITTFQKTSVNLRPNHQLLDFSTDGATLDAQGKIQMWPIQIRIANIPQSKPKIVGIWRGSSKPSYFNELFTPFVEELLELLSNGGVS